MKRIVPRREYSEEDTYPSLVDQALPETTPPARRVFLQGAVALGAAMAGSLLPSGGAPARGAGGRRGQQRVKLPVRRRYTFRYGNYQLQSAVAQTGHAGLARFLGDPKEAATVEQAMRKIFDRHSCVDLLNGRRLTQLQERVGTALAASYRQRTGRAAPRPTVVLFVGVPNDTCDGDCPAVTPVCRPPKP